MTSRLLIPSPIRIFFILLLALPWWSATGFAQDGPLVAIIIDDLGHRAREGRRAVALPVPVTCAVLPHTPMGARLARAANAVGKEVMLHQPLQSLDDGQNSKLGPGAIWLDTTRVEFAATLADNLAAVPYVRGVNNHMGSLLTRHPGHMAWLMEELASRDNLYFVDSVTTDATVAARLAREHGLPNLRRDIFLDADPEPDAIGAQLEQLLTRARRYGHAVGIGHPYPTTMDVLEAALPDLHERGYRFVTISQLLAELAEQRRAQELGVSAGFAAPPQVLDSSRHR